MKRLTTMLALSCALGVAACDDPVSNEPEYADAPVETSVAPAAEDAMEPVSDPNAVETPPADTTTLPADRKSSEESVQPESETLFY